MNLNILELILIAAGGALGACARFIISNLCARIHLGGVVAGTLAVNLLGCLLIGLFMGATKKFELAGELRLFFVTGFLGALTTFSTFSHESLQLLSEHFLLFGANVLLNVICCLCLTYVGYLIFK